ncbi:hypothetical protein WR25_12863 isoform B [Diploscapter pachys]|nr:hypothetical protein WR25_12863 isoform B [Diploscapter pachys]
MSKKIALIQNPGLGEFKIRDMNDDINRLMRLKNAWEHRIKTIGGPDYRRIAPKQLDREGREVSSNKGYKYFGAAKDLPGVRELFKKSDEAEVLRKARAELMKHVDPGYYGYIAEDNRKMIEAEQEQEKVAVAEAERKFAEEGPERIPKGLLDDDGDIYKIEDDSDDEGIETKESVVVGEDGERMVIRHVMVPSQNDIEDMLLERKKQALREKYLGEEP